MSAKTCILAVVACLAAAPPAQAKHETATAGAVTATFTYFGSFANGGYHGLELAIARAGTTVYDKPVAAQNCDKPSCAPGGAPGKSVHARDLDGDGEPEVLLDLYTGGAHCCFLTQIFAFAGTTYRKATEHDWADAGYHLADLNHDGKPEFKSADARFAYRFAAYAFSGFPIRILRWRDDRFLDATSRFRRLVRKDARRWLRIYRHADIEPQGALAAWAADQYRLGHRRYARRVVRRAVTTGKLRTMPGAARFPHRLDRTLRRLGYAH